jgi:hypothetical protein
LREVQDARQGSLATGALQVTNHAVVDQSYGCARRRFHDPPLSRLREDVRKIRAIGAAILHGAGLDVEQGASLIPIAGIMKIQGL